MKCPGAETLLRAVIDNDEGAGGAVKRERWLAGQDITYLQELADSLRVLGTVTERAMTSRREAAR